MGVAVLRTQLFGMVTGKMSSVNKIEHESNPFSLFKSQHRKNISQKRAIVLVESPQKVIKK